MRRRRIVSCCLLRVLALVSDFPLFACVFDYGKSGTGKKSVYYLKWKVPKFHIFAKIVGSEFAVTKFKKKKREKTAKHCPLVST